MPPDVIDLRLFLHTCARLRIVTAHGLTQPVYMLRGVRQGNPESPLQYALLLETLLRAQGHRMRPQGGAEHGLIQAYIDDLLVVAHTLQHFVEGVEAVAAYLTRQDARPPPHRPSRRQRTPGYGDTQMGTRRARCRWHPKEDGAAQLAVAHFKAGGPVYDDALSRLSDIQGPLLLMLPTDIAAALRQELDGCEGLRVGWEAVADGTLLALLHRDAANGCQWDALTPHLTGRHVYMATPPQGHPRPAWDDLIAAFHDHGILPDDTWREVQRKTLGRDYRRRVRAGLLEIRDPPRQRWDDLWFRHLDPWSPPSHLPHTCAALRGM